MEEDEEKIKMVICPFCGNKVVYQEGCMHCIICGWGACDS